MKKVKVIIMTLGLLCVQGLLYAQTKQTSQVGQTWVGYFNQTRLSDKWGFWAEAQLRTKEDYFSGLSQSIVRLGATYYLNNDTKFTAGYAYVNHFPAEGHTNISQTEHRLWQQLQWHTKYKSVRLMQWFRLEERYRHKIKNNDELADGYLFNFRARYNFFSLFSLSKKKFQPGTISFVLNDEVMVNFGKEIVYNYFDQNRFFLGLKVIMLIHMITFSLAI